MALKGFLASGFQKLIGASRIRGANDQWLGEPNVQVATFTGAPTRFSNTLVFGDNVLTITGAAEQYINPTEALFSTTPTVVTRVQLVNTGTGFLEIRGRSSVVGGYNGSRDLVLFPGTSETLVYDPTSQRWYQDSSSGRLLNDAFLNIAGGATSITIANNYAPLISMYLNPASLSQNNAITTVNVPFAADTIVNSGQILVLYTTQVLTGEIKLVQFNGTTGNLYINGDFVFSAYSSIVLLSTESKWIEISRTNLSF